MQNNFSLTKNPPKPRVLYCTKMCEKSKSTIFSNYKSNKKGWNLVLQNNFSLTSICRCNSFCSLFLSLTSFLFIFWKFLILNIKKDKTNILSIFWKSDIIWLKCFIDNNKFCIDSLLFNWTIECLITELFHV